MVSRGEKGQQFHPPLLLGPLWKKRIKCMVSRGEKGQQCNLIQPKSTPHVQECRQQTRRINLAPNIVSVRTRKNTTVSMNCNIWATFTAYIRSCDDTGCSTRCQSRKRRNRVGAEISVSVKVTHHSPLQLTHHSSAHFKWPPSTQFNSQRGENSFWLPPPRAAACCVVVCGEQPPPRRRRRLTSTEAFLGRLALVYSCSEMFHINTKSS